jgi:hypothetical protein
MMSETIDPLILQFLEWVSLRSRTYEEAMDAWRSSCPRHTTWEDALVEGFIEVAGTDASSPVLVTSRGQRVLDNSRRESMSK